jgi:hypothetical protein
MRERGEPVPEAHLWRLTDGMVRSGRLRTVQMTESEFAAAVTKYCPDVAHDIFRKVGMEAHELAVVNRRGRSAGKRTVAVTAPTPIATGA